jgi:plasmid maintenance system antidote protein VapI
MTRKPAKYVRPARLKKNAKTVEILTVTPALLRSGVKKWIEDHMKRWNGKSWGYFQRDLAQRLGVREATVSAWLHGSADIDFFTVMRMCFTFAVPQVASSSVQYKSQLEEARDLWLELFDAVRSQFDGEA